MHVLSEIAIIDPLLYMLLFILFFHIYASHLHCLLNVLFSVILLKFAYLLMVLGTTF